MAKLKTQYVCRECGRTTPKPLGRCPQCGSWNSMVGEEVATKRGSALTATRRGVSRVLRLSELEGQADERVPLAIGEFSRVLGGGIVPGSVVLIGGDPGIGKSTLLLQMALAVAANDKTLYVSGEESERQIKGRAVRLTESTDFPENFYVLAETDLHVVLDQVRALSPSLVVVDSIQTMALPEIESTAGSITQVRESTSRLQSMAKESDVAVFLVGHVTKEGAIAGPKVMEHIVDTVLYLEGDPFHAYRLLRSAKNRFGATTEVGVFEMRPNGMKEVLNPSEAFLAERVTESPGSAIAVTMEGTRPILVEIQGLTSLSSFGHPRRTANGVDFNRLLLTIAVLSRRVGLRLADQDVFANVVGGLRVGEPAADLALAASIASSFWDRPHPADTAFIGEIGLSGELRSVAQLSARLKEAAKLGFRRVVVPRGSRSELRSVEGLDVVPARSLREALSLGEKGG